MGRLTNLKVTRTRAPGRYGDGEGLWLQVSPVRRQVLAAALPASRPRPPMGLGSVQVVSLAEARERAPGLHASSCSMGSTRCGAATPAGRAAPRSGRNGHIQAGGTGRDRVARGDMEPGAPAAVVDDAGAVCLPGHWPPAGRSDRYPAGASRRRAVAKTREVTADRLRQRIEAVLNWAGAHGYRSGDNPARWRGHLRTPAHRRRPSAGAPRGDAVWRGARLYARLASARGRRATGTRVRDPHRLPHRRSARRDVGRDRWRYVDDTRRSHEGWQAAQVPLSRRALSCRQLPREGDFVVHWPRAGRPLERHAMRDLLQAHGRAAITVHGFRFELRDWAAGRTQLPARGRRGGVGAHIPSKVEAAYLRGALFEKRKKLMAAWAEFCAVPAIAGDVVPRGSQP